MFDKNLYAEAFKTNLTAGKIKPSQASFKIKQFLDKAENSLSIAQHVKDLKPTNDQPKRMHWDYWTITISYYSMLYAAKAAILSKGYEVNGHDVAQIALGHLLVPNELEKKDLEILKQSHKIFEDEYVQFFGDAKTESYIARYSSIKTYTERQKEELFENARLFIGKIAIILQD